MNKQHDIDELKACVITLDDLLIRLKELTNQMEAWRKNTSLESPATGAAAISFSEVRQINIICKNALMKVAPDLTNNWYISPIDSCAGPEEITTIIYTQRSILKHAISRFEQHTPTKMKNESTSKEIVILKPSFFGFGVDLKALWSFIKNKSK